MNNKSNLEQICLNESMHIGAGDEIVYENKHLCVNAEVVVDGILRLKNCMIDAQEARIRVNGTFRMENCVVHQPKSEFLWAEEDAEAKVIDSVFYCGLPFDDSVIIARDNRNFLMQDCRFEGSPVVVSNLLKKDGRSVRPFEVPFIDANKGKICKCSFENFSGCRVANVLYLVDTLFENCHRIEVGGSGEETGVARCKFVNCKEVNVYDGTVELCVFMNIETMYANLTEVKGCRFYDLKCDFDHIIFLEDSNMENCGFDGVTLTEDAYLIEATGESVISHCRFRDCRTSREDLELIHAEETRGTLFRKKVEYDVVDHRTCIGLDAVERL